jgi:pimeloyl-ACP methyl ester carboxylesterase
MSRPPTFTPPPCARSRMLRTARGNFAVLDAVPSDGVHSTALLLPGYTGSKEDFIALLEPLAEAGFRVLSVDGRGQYESERAGRQEAYSQAELARDVLAQAAAVDGVPLSGGIHLLGHSLGGQIARAAVLLDAAPFRSLTLMSSGPAEIDPEQQKKVQLLGDALGRWGMAEIWQTMRALDPPEDADTGDGEELRRRWMRHDPAQLIATGAQLSSEPDRVAELAALSLPVHVISGERDDVWPLPLLDGMARRLGAHRTVIEGAEHSPNTARPLETAASLVSFWNSL